MRLTAIARGIYRSARLAPRPAYKPMILTQASSDFNIFGSPLKPFNVLRKINQ